jgi:membrane protein YqaA with SNARE-associated domain
MSAAMGLLTLLLFCFASGIIWLFNAEAACILAAGSGRWSPVTVGVVCALGQTLAYTFLYFGGTWLRDHWRWWRAQLERAETRWGRVLQRSFLALTAPAALIGIPPMTAMAALAGSFKVRFLWMIAIALIGRSVRFQVLAHAGVELAVWWSRLWS